MSSDDSIAFADNEMMDSISTVAYPLARLSAAGLSIWFAAAGSKETRYFSGVLTGILSGFLLYLFLEPLFFPVGLNLAVVVLWVLAILSAFVGMSLGVLLPTLFPGLCFGVNLALLGGCFLNDHSVLYFPVAGGVLALAGAFLSVRWNVNFVVTYTTILQIGAIAASLVLQSTHRFIMDIARGYPFYPDGITVAGEDRSDGIVYGLVWLAGSLLVAGCIAYRDGDFGRLSLLKAFGPKTPDGYVRVAVTNGKDAKSKARDKFLNRRDPPPVSEAFNMFDPADLPPRLAEYANMVYSACEDLGNFFGFQDSSVRNQAEHLLILLSNNRRYMSSHILPPSVQPPSPIHALHAKVFSNYVKWCRAMGVRPHFSKMNTSMSAPPAVASRVVDLVLYFCIWGEGSNLRHMAECVWFLYHKMMEEYIKSEGYTQTRSLYAGHFLDNVIEPIYTVLLKSTKLKFDHFKKKNYDDFNEFFWSRNCLRFHYSDDDYSSDPEGMSFVSALPGETLTAVSEGMDMAPKTFLEKRSWLRGILALNRIIEWHIVTFYLLAVVAFSRELVWGWVYSVQLGSGVFLIFNFLFLFWQLLEVWGTYPGIQLSATEVCGSVLILSSRLLTLIYQSLYLMWAFSPQKGVYMGIAEDSTFWWWQYIWLSLLVMTPYLLETIPQIYPPLATKILTSQNDYVQSFLNILYPSSRLYVGKEVHESLGHTLVYLLFWFTLMVWKLSFSYVFEVYSMVKPSLQLTDDYVNYPNQSFAKMMLLLIMRWLPQFIVYMIDMSIWYAAWQAFAGTAVGFSDNLGDIRSIADIRENFGRAPELFCKKMLSPDAGSRRGSSASFLGSTSQNSLGGHESSSLLGSNPQRLQSYVNRLLDVRIQKWVMFSAAWNEIIDYFREEDIVSYAEMDNLKFSQFDGFSQAIYLPVFQTAGAIEDVLSELERPAEEYTDPKTFSYTDETYFKPISEHVTMQTAVSEVWELGAFLINQTLGPIHSVDVNAVGVMIQSWAEDGVISSKIELQKTRVALKSLVDTIKLLEKGIKKRKPASKPRSKFKTKQIPKRGSGGGMRRAVSAGSLGQLGQPDVSEQTQSKDLFGFEKKQDVQAEKIIDAVRDQVRDKLRNFIQSVKSMFKCKSDDPESRDILDRLTFLVSMENGFFWDDAYASDMLDDVSKNSNYKDVLKKVHGLLCLHPDDVEPKSKEVVRRLTFFTNSLFMDMPDAPSIHDMFSWNVLTPYYSEPVTYSKGDLESRSDALGVSTMLYLQTLYRDEWNNYLERTGIKDEEKLWSTKHTDDTRRWASIRAQTLSRTVNGMMYYEKALRLLANMERLDEDTTNDLIGEKFGYVVSCQIYGNMKRNQDSKADDIDALLHRYPHLRVAYIDTVRLNRDGAALFYSVLVKSDGKGNIIDVYRVRLPGNPVIGEGKPENQNHAMIFTRSEFLQTIDMNQEGYFEEALKMRNCLQEFAKREGPLPTTILGLREHIFTGSVSSLANYMALQEISFVTLGQRVLTRPLHIRLHYGHPDVFDKLFFITRGGVSKSSKGINLSEDIFAGYNNVVRGGSVGFKEYLQVGKGRDVGMSQIYKFEAKLSQGAAEQSLSRDVYRMCHRLDFCRLLSFYYGGIGHYFSNVLTVLTVYIVVYLTVILAIFGYEKIGDRVITPMGGIQMMLGGLGLLQTIPLFATLGVERGWLASAQEILNVFVTGGPLHFMFHIQTKAFYMTQTILVGGAKYRPTGRGFVTQHTAMDEQYRFFAASHLYLGVELAAGLIIMGIFTEAGQYVGRTWSLWLASFSFMASPFWFNPLTFDWNTVVSDYGLWARWMKGTSGGSTKSWSMWYNEENSYYKNLPFSTKCIYFVKTAILLLVANGIWISDLFRSDLSLSNNPLKASDLLIILACLIIFSRLVSANERSLPYPVRRTLGILTAIGIVAVIVTIFVMDTNYLRYALAGYYGVGGISMLGLLYGFKSVKVFYQIHDIVCAHIIFIPLFLLAALQLPSLIQTWLLYHNALSTNVVISDILKYARKSKDSGGAGEVNEDLLEQVNELKKVVDRQEQMLTVLGMGVPSSTTLIAEAPVEHIPQRPQSATNIVVNRRSDMGRAKSMSGMELWGEMALGDVGSEVASQISQPAPQRTRARPQPASGDFQFSQPDTMPPR